MCPYQCKSLYHESNLDFLSIMLPNLGHPWFSYPFCTCLIAESLLKNFWATLQGAWRFTVRRWEKRQLKELWGFWIGFILQAVLVCVTACLGTALLPQFSSAEVEASSGNALCEVQWTSLDTGTGRGRRKSHCKVYGKVSGDWAMKKWRNVCQWLELRLFWGRVETRDE